MLSAIISTHESERALVPTLAALVPGATAGLLGEVIVADAGSYDATAGLLDGLRRVKWLPATTGEAGTLMGFGTYDHAALKGHYLVLREWKDGKSVQVAR